MRGALFLLLYLSMLPAAVSAAHVSMMFYVWVSLIAPSVFIFGPLEAVPYSKIAIFIVMIAIASDRSHRKPYIDSYYLFSLAFFIQCAVSFSASLTEITQFYTVADRVWKIALLSALMNPVLRGRFQIHSILLIIAIAMGVQGAMEGLKFLISGGAHVMVVPATFGDNNDFGLFLLMTLPIFLYLFKYTIDPFVRLAIIGGILINILAIVGTGSRGAIVGALAVTLALILQSKRRLPTLLVVAAIAGMVAWFAPSKVYDRVETIQTAGEDQSFMSRVTMWKLNTLVGLDRPLLGGGFSSVEDPKIWAAYASRFSALDFIPSPLPDRPRAAHSIYFQALGDTGLTGLLLYLGILASTFLSLRKIRRTTVKDAAMGWAYDLAGYLRLTMIAFVVSGAALSLVYYELPFIIFSLISILRRTVRDEIEAQSTQPALGRQPPAWRSASRKSLATG